jgi:hypothetical protein
MERKCKLAIKNITAFAFFKLVKLVDQRKRADIES